MEHTQTYEKNVFAALTESACKTLTEIRTVRSSLVATSALHVLFVLLVVLGKKSLREIGDISDDELKKHFGHIKSSLTACFEIKKLTYATNGFGMYGRFSDHMADDWKDIAERCLLAADPDIKNIIGTYGIREAMKSFDDVRETLDMLDTPEWDETFEYLAAN